MNKLEFCNKIVTIPIFKDTCWFNAILMALLYSQNSRKLLLYDNIYKKNKSNKLYEVINNILTKYYISQKKALEYYNILRPEKILEIVDSKKNIINRFITTNDYNYSVIYFLPFFIKKIGKTCITLDFYNNKYYYKNLYKCLSYTELNIVDFFDKVFLDKYLQNHKTNLIDKMSKIDVDNPDYILINHYFSVNIKNQIEYIKTNFPELKSFNKYKINKFDDIITYNGNKYILDSCLIGNSDSGNIDKDGNRIIGHAIAGITCKKTKYVYNSWDKENLDIFDTQVKIPSPCELMKFNWDVNNKDINYCLNSKLCKLEENKLNKTMCYSFGKGVRTLIYVKMNTNFKSLDIDKNSRSSSSISLISKPVIDDNLNFCNKIVTIPQFTNIAWFNSILMSILYSETSRKLLLYKKDKSNIFYNFIKNILNKYYISYNNDLSYYYTFPSENILKKFIIDDYHYNYILKNNGNIDYYLSAFIRSIGKKCITFDNYDNNIYIKNIMNSISNFNINIENLINYKRYDIENIKNNYNTDDNIDYIIINNKNNKDYYKYIYNNLKNDLPNIFNNTNDIIINNFDDIINYKGISYILDSCIINNRIVCLKCKNNKYIYNGWIKTTQDSYITNRDLINDNIVPCELIKFDWDVNNKTNNYCLNLKTCKITKTCNSNCSLCFSFGNSDLTLIYVKNNIKYKSKNIMNDKVIYSKNSSKMSFDKTKSSNSSMSFDKTKSSMSFDK